MRERVRDALDRTLRLSVLAKFLAAIVFGFGVGIALQSGPTSVPLFGPVRSQFVGAAILGAGALVIYAITELRGD